MTLKTLLTLCRFSNLPTVWMNVLAAALLVSHSHATGVSTGDMVLVGIAISLLYCGGMSLNDYCDRHWDAQHQPFRPIPAGKASAASVGWLAFGLLVAGMGLLLLAPCKQGFVAGLILLATIAAYDRFHKAHPATVLLMATARLLVFVVTAMALSPDWSSLIWLAGGLQFGYTLLVTVVARHEHTRDKAYSFPLIPRMIAGMAMLDGMLLAVVISPYWLLAGIGAAILTRLGQRYVRGD